MDSLDSENQDNKLNQCKEAGMDDLIFKPFKPVLLEQIIDRVILIN